VDEGDHFVGGSPTPADCDGVNVPCDWTGQIGEISANIDTLVSHQFPSLAATFLGSPAPDAFTVHGDDAPTFYLAAKGSGALTQTDPNSRQFERDMANLTAVNPYTGATDHLLDQMGDQTEMKALHMFTSGDPARNATFVFFGDPDYFITDFPSSTCETCLNPAFAWNHGDIQPEIRRTWLGLVGPGVRNLGQTEAIWTDHTDVRPTMLDLLGLNDTYESDGRVVLEVLDPKALSPKLRSHGLTASALGAAYKQLNAPFGSFGLDTLKASTRALKGDDKTYSHIEARIDDLTTRRDALAAKIRKALNDVEFEGKDLNEGQALSWIIQSSIILVLANAL
jgi:hypothetical protein